MVKKPSELSARDERVLKKKKLIKDNDIDFSDIPEATTEELTVARRVGRPKLDVSKQLIAIRIDPILLKKLKKMATKSGIPYQTLIHELLEGFVKKSA